MYSDETPSERTCRVWFERFRNDNFDVKDKERWIAEKIWRCWAARIARWESSSNAFRVVESVKCYYNGCLKTLAFQMEKIHKEEIWLPHKLSENGTLNRFESLSRFLCLPGKKKVFCGVSWLAMKNGFILIIPSGRNHGWTAANHPLQRRRGIFTGIRPCSDLVVPGECAVLRAFASKWNHYSWSLPTAIMPIE